MWQEVDVAKFKAPSQNQLGESDENYANLMTVSVAMRFKFKAPNIHVKIPLAMQKCLLSIKFYKQIEML
jgi:hypothetical protein